MSTKIRRQERWGKSQTMSAYRHYSRTVSAYVFTPRRHLGDAYLHYSKVAKLDANSTK